MSDKDREAFEAWVRRCNHFDPAEDQMWEAWQACAAHHAPKLSEKEAVERAAKAIQNDSLQQVMPGSYCGISDYDAKRYAVQALKAANIQFKERP
jgi:ferric-dicitrate binding protein FerR (iron transport regulator)